MGMSASQARFLSLTARKSNVEYEGQQINQQRTALSNESGSYYNKLNTMAVPTPPSTSDYTKTVYKFMEGNVTNTIDSMIAQKDGFYLVNYTKSYSAESVIPNGTVLVVRSENEDKTGFDYYIGATKLRILGEDYSNDTYLSTLNTDERADVLKREQQYQTLLQEKYKDQNWAVKYTKNSDGIYNPVFYSLEQIQNSKYSEEGVSLNVIKSYMYGPTTETHEIKGAKARAEQDSSGRYKNIIIYSEDGQGNVEETEFNLEVTSTTDENGYKDAMNKYYYDKQVYERTVQDVNSKLAQVQAQDKSLELKLKRLDTEQSAISVEMEAIQKVISKNISDTFKTFEA